MHREDPPPTSTAPLQAGLNPAQELLHRRTQMRGMGGTEKLATRRRQGQLNARERIDRLLDPDSFLETGLHATSHRPEMRATTPADGKVCGFGKIDGRDVAVVSNDFTVMGASSSYVNGQKIGHLKQIATGRGLPMVFLGESTGARMPDAMGVAVASGDRPAQYQRTRETPWASALLGPCFGSSAWYAALSDFVVMRRDAVLAVSSPRLTAMAIGEAADPAVLGGSELHLNVTGMVDAVVDTDEAALLLVRRFLSYLPSHHREAAPRAAVPPGSGEDRDRIDALLPAERSKVYDVRKLLQLIVDADSLFELKRGFGRSLFTALARIDGRSVGVIANNPLVRGGAIDADACAKATSFMVLCDSFNLPLLFFVDQPGFMIGAEGEKRGVIGKVMNWMNALSQVTVPKISVIMRKSYGQAVLNMGGGGNSDYVLCWNTAEVNFMDPRSAVAIVHGLHPGDERHAEALQAMTRGTSAYDMAAGYHAHDVILPGETRDTLARLLEIHALRLSNGVSEHRMRTWPTSYL
jgi:acetyl-CoA carboxylase carboxyltransferase component